MDVLLLSADLMTQSRVEAAAARCGATLRTVVDPAAIVQVANESSARLLIIDLTLPSLGLASLVAQLKLPFAAAPVRIVAFGPHVHESLLTAAAQAGCDEVTSRGQFFTQLDAILARSTSTLR
jgi:DNA-binding NarL/FixJ family response regulator